MKKGGEKVLAMLKGGHKKFRGSYYQVARSFSNIIMMAVRVGRG